MIYYKILLLTKFYFKDQEQSLYVNENLHMSINECTSENLKIKYKNSNSINSNSIREIEEVQD